MFQLRKLNNNESLINFSFEIKMAVIVIRYRQIFSENNFELIAAVVEHFSLHRWETSFRNGKIENSSNLSSTSPMLPWSNQPASKHIKQSLIDV